MAKSTQRLKVAVVMGGYSAEREISLLSGAHVCEHLDPQKFEVYAVDIEKDSWNVVLDDQRVAIDRNDFSFTLKHETIHFDVVFNAIHGTPGEDGILAAYFELLQIKQTASDHYASALTFNKRDLLLIAKQLGIPSARSVAVNLNDSHDFRPALQALNLPVFVKANRSGSSFGIEKINAFDELLPALERVADVDKEILVEEALIGPEITVGVIQLEGELVALPVTLIETDNTFFDFEAKYLGASREITPAPLPEDQLTNAKEWAVKLHRHLGLKGVSRAEFILVDGIPHLLEINTTPGLTKQSIIPQQLKAAGLTLAQLFEAMIDQALND
ncbi:MAG: D-alanine--D-alanine ligase [Flavobacteriaceae bacterium]